MTVESLVSIAGAGGGSSDSGAATQPEDTLQSKAYISILDLLGEGQIGGLIDGAKSIYFDNTPVQNADDSWNFTVESIPDQDGVTTLSPAQFSYTTRDGQQVQSPMSGYSDVEMTSSVGVQARQGAPAVTATIVNESADAVRLIVAVPSLISQNSSGDISGSSVQFKFTIATNDGVVANLSPTLTISGQTHAKYQREYQYNLPKTGAGGIKATKWVIGLERITPNSETSSVANDLYFDSYVEIVNVKLTYPNSALVGVTIDARQFSSIPARSYLVNGLYIKVPSNYNAATRKYTGVWNGTFVLAVSSNPAWVLYDVLTSKRYGLGQFLLESQVDKAKLYEIGRYCDAVDVDGTFVGIDDGFGHKEPRFAINTAIQSQAEAYKLVSDLTSVFRGMGFWTGGMVGFTQDSPADPSMVYSPANVIDGLFTYMGSARRDRHSVAMVTWNDPSQFYKQVIEYVEDPEMVLKFGIRKIEVVAFGCTSRGQANRVGKWILYTEKYESDVINFGISVDGAMTLPGDIIKIHDPARAGKRLGGRLVASTTTSATLDAPVTLSVGSTISIRLPDGTFADRAVVQSGADISTVTWVLPLTALPVANAIWLIAETSLVPALARVIGISQTDKPGVYNITALEHNPSKFAAIEQDLVLEIPKVSIINAQAVEAPYGMTVVESQYLVAPGLIGLAMSVAWSGNASRYEVTWKRTGPYPTKNVTAATTLPSLELANVREGIYSFSVVAINPFGKRSAAIYKSYIPVGQMTAPGDVANFQVTRRLSDLLLTWNPVTDIGAVTYEIRQGVSWSDSVLVTTKLSGTSVADVQNLAGNYTYFIRSINAAGRRSSHVATATISLLAPIDVVQFNAVQNGGNIDFEWRSNPEQNITGYEIREGVVWGSATLVAKIQSNKYSTSAFASAGNRTFWIKAIASPDIYSVHAVFSTTNVVMTSDRNAVFSDNEQTLGWLGSKFNVAPVTGALQMNPGVTYGEYTWGVSLPGAFRARNSIVSTFDTIFTDTTTWADVPYSWASVNASRLWVTQGDISTVGVGYYISKWTGLGASYLEGFGLNQQTIGANLTPASQAVGVTYSAGRFLKGAVISDFTSLDWALALPSQFNVTFWAIPQAIAGNQVYWSATTSTGLKLMVGHDAANGWFYLEDTEGNKITVPYAIAVDDRILIGVVQTATTRKLHVGKLAGASASASAAFAPIGEFASMGLTQ